MLDPYWLRMEVVEPPDIEMTIAEAADFIDELYGTSICGEEDIEINPITHDVEEPTATDWDRAFDTINLVACQALSSEAAGDSGAYDTQIKVFRSHRRELYKLVLSNGTAGAPQLTTERISVVLDIEEQSSITLESPIISRPVISWSGGGGPSISIIGNTLTWGGVYTGTLLAEYNTEYDLINIHVNGIVNTTPQIITGTDNTWLGTGWYSGDEDGSEITDIQNIECSVLAFYHYQYEELILNSPDDEGVSDTDLEEICDYADTTHSDGDVTFKGPDISEEACIKSCDRSHSSWSQSLQDCYDACKKSCYKRVRYNEFCECGGDDMGDNTDQYPVPCPPGFSDGSNVNPGAAAEEGGIRFIDCDNSDGIADPEFYENRCCIPPEDADNLPDCIESYGPYTGKSLTADEAQAIIQQYGSKTKIIMVGPATGACGKTITTQDIPTENCCEFVDPIVWDDENSVEVLAPLHNGYVSVTGGADILTWSVRGLDITFEGGYRDVVAGRTVRLIAGEDFCGSCNITVDDTCSSVTGLVMSTIGEWVLLEIVSGFHPEICNAGYVNYPSIPGLGSGYIDANGRRYILRPTATELGCSSSGYSCSSGISDCCALYVDCESSGPKPCIDKFYHGSSGGTYYENWNGTNVYAVNGRICVDGYPGDPAVFSVAESTTEVWGWECDS